MTGKLVPGLARAMERTTNFEYKQSEDNSLANRKFSSCYNIEILNRIQVKNVLFLLNFT